MNSFMNVGNVNMIAGKYINSENDIFPQDVPMNGNTAAFINRNGEFVILKRWNRNGELEEIKYIPENAITKEATAIQSSEAFNNKILEALGKIETILDERLFKPRPYNPNYKRNNMGYNNRPNYNKSPMNNGEKIVTYPQSQESHEPETVVAEVVTPEEIQNGKDDSE